MTRKTPELHQFISFFVAGQEFALPILRLCDVLLCDAVRALPSAQSAVRGALDYEGSILPAIDVGAKFGLTSSPTSPSTRVMIVVVTVGGDRTQVGVLVESINEGFELPRRRVEKAPNTVAGAEYLIGVVKLEDRSVPLIDVERLLSPADLELIAQLRSGGVEPFAAGAVGHSFNFPRNLPWKTA
ncbi:MAG TPA: chemotaxis protein CheW [Myxococcaceae bacterium]|nr:chemotaxis protein CheW [Myxococcaceae bacterium]